MTRTSVTAAVRLLLLVLALGLMAFPLGCPSPDPSTGGPGETGGGTTDEAALTDNWMFLVASDPGALKPIEADPAWDPWFAFFHNDLRGAVRLFSPVCSPSTASLPERAAAGYVCIGLARSHIELASFYAEAAELDRVVLRQFYSHRVAKADEVLPSVHSDYFSGLVLIRSGEVDAGRALLDSYASRSDADALLAALAKRISTGVASKDPLIDRIWGRAVAEASASPGLGSLPSTRSSQNYAYRVAFMDAVARGDLATAEGLQRPIRTTVSDFREELKAGSTTESGVQPVIEHNDPGYYVALSRFHALSARRALGGATDLAVLDAQAERLLGRASKLPAGAPSVAEGLPLVLFSAVASPSDLLSIERSWPSALGAVQRLKGLEASFGAAPTTNVADLDPFVAGSNRLKIRLGELISASSNEGSSMDTDMVLSERFRGQLLRERAAQFQASFDVRLDSETGADIATAGVAARSLLELALDKNPAPPNPALKEARISLRNDPPFLMSLARAEMDTRRPSEANDYIRPLSSVFPELVPLRDALTLLDTAWNPPRPGAVQK